MMVLSPTKLTTALGTAFAAVLFLGFTTPASGGPPPGMRWSDQAFGSSSRTSSYSSAPRAYRYAAPVVVSSAPAVTGTTAPTGTTIAIRQPDGSLRTFPVEGTTVQQGTPAFVNIRGADGIVRAYPVVTSPTTAAPAQPGATPAPTVVPPGCP